MGWRERIWGSSDVPLVVKPGTWRGVPPSAQLRNLADLLRGAPRTPTNNCLHCGAMAPADAAFCPSCGNQLANQNPSYLQCYACGTPNDLGARFCVQCGSAMAG
jgi:RNA polymerase subunit RPABC4/transcription elongation factor Spt4